MRNENNEFVQLLYEHIELFNENEIEDVIKLYDLAVSGDSEAMIEIAHIYRLWGILVLQ